jgi:glycosyltransferase involved in cell wall biosynthesis
MPESTLVSVVTPSFNSGRFIERTIRSILLQEHDPIEHIIVDGGSTDGTIEVLKRYPHLRWISEPDQGQSDALNKGFRIARGEIVGWLNADDTYNAGAVSSGLAFLEQRPEVGLVYSHCNIIDEDDRVAYRLSAPAFDMQRELVAHNLPQPTNFFRKAALAEVGYLNTDLHYVMDWELYLRLGLKYPIANVDAVWANFRECAGTKTVAHPERFWVEYLRVLDAFYGQPGLPANLHHVRNRAYGRAFWMAGILQQAMPSETDREAGRAYCRQSLQAYPLLDKDLDFALTHLTDCAVRRVGAEQADSYVRGVFAALPLRATDRERLLPRALGRLYASMVLMLRDPSISPSGVRRDWLRLALRNDPRWIGNGGIRSLVARETWLALKRRIDPSR